MARNAKRKVDAGPQYVADADRPAHRVGLVRRYWWVSALVAAACVFLAWSIFGRPRTLRVDEVIAAYHASQKRAGVEIQYPRNRTVFPPEIIPPTFRWDDTHPDSDGWAIHVEFGDGQAPIRVVADQRQWTPSEQLWEEIKKRSTDGEAEVLIVGVNRRRQRDILSAGRISISTSNDEVGAPIFYREVNLPFEEAVKDPAEHIRWRFGPVSSKERPPIVLEKLPVCGNCHSFSADGGVLGMDVDYGNDKASYVISDVSPEVVFDRDKLITWSDYRPEDGRRTFGLLSRVSPDGRYVLSTVKDRSVFLPVNDLAYSQLFFPIQGILAYYDRQTRTYHSLHGADDDQYVQSNPVWSPDGKYVVFARAKAFQLDNLTDKGRTLLKSEDVPQFATRKQLFKFDLWRVPFNDGRGGQAEPLKGASNNGMSNYFAKYSPNGKWIVFCRAKSYMLLQADSELYIIPAEGGEARRLECNTPQMNSWHSWSPNSKWLVFSSKANSPYTQLFLTHIDDDGRATPPVVLSQFTAGDRAANIPEFVNASPAAIRTIHDEFVDEDVYLQASGYSLYDHDYEMALKNIKKAIEMAPDNSDTYQSWAVVLMLQGKLDEAKEKIAHALELSPNHVGSYCTLGQILRNEGNPRGALSILEKAIALDPHEAAAHSQLGATLIDLGRIEEGRKHLEEALRIDPKDSFAHRRLGMEASKAGNDAEAALRYQAALQEDGNSVPALLRLAVLMATTSDPELRDMPRAVSLARRACNASHYRDPIALITLSEVLAADGRLDEAASVAEDGLTLAEERGDAELVEALRVRLNLYRQGAPPAATPD